MVAYIRKSVLVFIAVVVVLATAATLYIRTHPTQVYELTEHVAAAWNELLLPFRIAELAQESPDNELTMPVAGVSVDEVTDTWGELRSGDREHQGQDIFAEEGTPIYSATEGYVVRIGEGQLGGNFVFVVGAGGRRYYYAHMERFAPGLKEGDKVTRQTLIGYIGNTGNAEATPPHLHFGVYGRGGAIDPLPLLVERK